MGEGFTLEEGEATLWGVNGRGTLEWRYLELKESGARNFGLEGSLAEGRAGYVEV